MDSKANTFIDLFPLYFRPEDFKYRATGHASARSLLVTADEAYVLKMLAREKSMDGVNRLLHQRNHRIEVDLANLVTRLKGARLIRNLNGQLLEKPYVSVWRMYGSYCLQGFRQLGTRTARASLRLFGALLPVSLLVWLGKTKYQWFYPRAQRHAIIDAVASKMSAALPQTTPAQRHRLAKHHFQITEVEKNLDLFVLTSLPHRRIGPWALARAMNLNVEAIKVGLAAGQGALIFHFHFGPIQLLSVILTALGFRVTVLGANIARAREADMLMRIVDHLGPTGVHKLYAALKRNEIVMISPDPDVHPIGARKTSEPGFRDKFAGSWQRSSMVDTSLLGYRVHAYKGIAWLHAETQAPLFYAEIQSRPNQRLDISFNPFEPPQRGNTKKSVWCRDIMDAIFRLYQRRLLSEPAQWEHWLSFFRYVNLQVKPKTPWMVLGKGGQDILVSNNSKIKVSRYVVQPFKDEKSLIIRMGTQSVMLTNPLGLAALAHLRGGITILELKAALNAAGFTVEDTPIIYTFLRSVKATGLLARIDGIPVRQPSLSVQRWLVHAVRTKLYPTIYRTVDRRLGLTVRQKLLPLLEWWVEGRFKYAAQHYHVRNNMRALLPDLPRSVIEPSVKSYFKEEVHADLTSQFTRRKVGDVFSWLDHYVEKHVVGMEALEHCLAKGKGVIFAGFHFGLYWLLPALLWRRGYRIHAVTGTVPQSEDTLETAGPAAFPNAHLQFHDTQIQSIARLPDFLAQGDSVLIYADSVGRFSPEVNRQIHKTWGKSAKTKKSVTLLDHPFPLQPGVGWLHKQSGAPVFPSFLYRNAKTGRAHLAFEPPLAASPEAPMRRGKRTLEQHAIHQALFQVLGQWITRYPEQWRNLFSFPHQPMKHMID